MKETYCLSPKVLNRGRSLVRREARTTVTGFGVLRLAAGRETGRKEGLCGETP